jgi:predicted transcriptional regulator containing an HTH domain and an uncharacterized domain shared with the mammalian protein schlafen
MELLLEGKPNDSELCSILNKLILSWESEVVEFKEAGKDYDKNKIGQYFSAISNEANLKGLQHGWLVFGVRNKDRMIVGSDYRNSKGLDVLKQEISVGTTGGISFIEIYEVYPLVDGEKKRVILFQIPAATTATPTGWNDHFYGRNGESLGALSVEEIDRIRGQEKKDWSKQIVLRATIKHLDKNAIKLARENYKKKMNKQYISEEVDQMSDEQFLKKLKLMIDGRLTNAAMLLLGNEDYDYLFQSVPEASWRIYDSKNDVNDYEIFKIPYITLSERLFGKIRNLTYRYMPNQLTLFPTETKQYDMWLLRELLNNCIAHSEYTYGGRIYLNEFEDRIILTNPGSFLPGRIEPILNPGYNPPFYRNQLLAETMVKLNMIDSQSTGIRRVFRIQKERYFPLPDYDFSNRQQVKVCIYGRILDENYSHILFKNPDFDLETVFLIDCVQKGIKIDKDAVKYLRKLKIIEGKIPNVFLSATISETIGEKDRYVKNKAFDDQYYKDLIVKYLAQYGSAKRKDINALLWDKLPSIMEDKRKEDKIRNLLTSLRKQGIIRTDSGNQQKSSWILADKIKQGK